MKHLKKFNEDISNNSERFFFSQDGDSHWYMIPVSLKERWNKYSNEDSDEAEDIINSEFGQFRTGGGISNITFENPI